MKLKLRTAIVLTDVAEVLTGWASSLLRATANNAYVAVDHKVVNAVAAAEAARRRADEVEAQAKAKAQSDAEEITRLLANSGRSYMVR
jgi:hypothetical protein